MDKRWKVSAQYLKFTKGLGSGELFSHKPPLPILHIKTLMSKELNNFPKGAQQKLWATCPEWIQVACLAQDQYLEEKELRTLILATSELSMRPY